MQVVLLACWLSCFGVAALRERALLICYCLLAASQNGSWEGYQHFPAFSTWALYHGIDRGDQHEFLGPGHWVASLEQI